MSVSVLSMSMSLDGYIADPNDHLGGDDGNRLHQWALTPDGELFRPSGPAGALLDEMNATGALLVRRRTAELVDHWSGDHRGRGIPIFVPSHHPPARHRCSAAPRRSQGSPFASQSSAPGVARQTSVACAAYSIASLSSPKPTYSARRGGSRFCPSR